ncbi:type III polyketide synthase [Rhodopirellula sp.]|nr:type III polyketide synthase [Rhodopirellula sp.]MDB4393917.1 type III polyketide synthase [Rhodopirellula sp.]
MSNATIPQTKNTARQTGGRLTGIGTAVPRYRANRQASASFATKISRASPVESRKIQALYRRTGIEHRGSVLLEESADSDIKNSFYTPAADIDDRGPGTKLRNDRYRSEAPALANKAARTALNASGLQSDQITHLITVSCTGFNAPGIDIALIDELKLPYTTQRIQVGFMGCHAAINGLRAANGLIAADKEAKVLMCCVELCSLHYQYGMVTDHIVSNALFADGSAAIVLESDPDNSPLDELSEGSTNDELFLGSVDAVGSFLVPESRDAMTWCIGDNGYQMTLSARVPHLIEQHLATYLSDFLEQNGESINSIGGWAVHPGGSRILSAVENALSLPVDALSTSKSVLSDHGNMSSATMLFIVERFAAKNEPKPWLMLGFGPGLEIEVSLIR